MARIIVNDGTGPRSIELEGLVALGSNPSCDIVLEHPSALGARLELKPLKFGYRAKLIKGEAALNEAHFELADLDHNDTLRVGEVLILYKQPEGADFVVPAALPVGLELLDDPVEELEELEELGELEELEELEELPELDVVEEAHEVEEIDLLAVAKAEAAPVVPDASFEEALLRARWKRLELLRRLQEVEDGEVDEFPELSEAGALDEVQHLDMEGRAGPLERYSTEHELDDLSLPELGARVTAALAARAAAAASPAAEESTDEAPEELTPLDTPEDLEQLEELETLDELPAEPEPAVSEPEAPAVPEPIEELELTDLEPLEPEPAPEAIAGVVAGAAAAGALVGAAASSSTPAAAQPAAAAARADAPAGVRPLPPEGIRWKRPLPPGRRAPSYLPPARPGVPRS